MAWTDYDPVKEEIQRRLKAVHLLALDFDGVLTDNHVYTFADGREAVRSWRGDGMGIERLKKLGVRVIVISSEVSQIVERRCLKLGLEFHSGVTDKEEKLLDCRRKAGLRAGEVAYIGNDQNDLRCLMAVDVPFIVADAHPSLRDKGFYETKARGGEGAVREVCDMIADAQENHV